jgi:hypothetical protein
MGSSTEKESNRSTNIVVLTRHTTSGDRNG